MNPDIPGPKPVTVPFSTRRWLFAGARTSAGAAAEIPMHNPLRISRMQNRRTLSYIVIKTVPLGTHLEKFPMIIKKPREAIIS
jgi:hypothetical protein